MWLCPQTIIDSSTRTSAQKTGSHKTSPEVQLCQCQSWLWLFCVWRSNVMLSNHSAPYSHLSTNMCFWETGLVEETCCRSFHLWLIINWCLTPPPDVLLIFLFGFLQLGLILNSVQLWFGQFEWTPFCLFMYLFTCRRFEEAFPGLSQAEVLV